MVPHTSEFAVVSGPKKFDALSMNKNEPSSVMNIASASDRCPEIKDFSFPYKVLDQLGLTILLVRVIVCEKGSYISVSVVLHFVYTDCSCIARL